MKTSARHFTSYGNISLVQIKAEPETNFIYKPAGPGIQSGDLIISESTGQGVVSKLLAINKSGSYLLLTDADVLVGAKQNRIINKSVLLAPLSKTILDVSCIERLRWNYKSKDFSTPNTVADPDLRNEKARSFSRSKSMQHGDILNTQGAVWSHISKRNQEEGMFSMTESYSELLEFNMAKTRHEFPKCEPEDGCNGLAVIMDRKVISCDIFGREEVYRHYFPLLRDAAFRMAVHAEKEIRADIHEAYFKVLDLLDKIESTKRNPDDTYAGSGKYSNIESSESIGSVLDFEGELIHQTLFSK